MVCVSSIWCIPDSRLILPANELVLCGGNIKIRSEDEHLASSGYIRVVICRWNSVLRNNLSNLVCLFSVFGVMSVTFDDDLVKLLLLCK